MTDLTDYGGGSERDEPDVVRQRVVWAPTSPGSPAGFMGRDRSAGSMVYTTRRKPYHFYRNGGGYAISTEILARLKRVDVPRILVWEADSGDVYEFMTRTYTDGTPVPMSEALDVDDPQKYVPLDEARHEWDSIAPEMFARDFSAALSRSTDRYGWDARDQE